MKMDLKLSGHIQGNVTLKGEKEPCPFTLQFRDGMLIPDDKAKHDIVCHYALTIHAKAQKDSPGGLTMHVEGNVDTEHEKLDGVCDSFVRE